MDLPNLPTELIHRILTHLPANKIKYFGKVLDIEILDYIYVENHKLKFRATLDAINSIIWKLSMKRYDSDDLICSYRSIPYQTILQCAYVYRYTTHYNSVNKFNSSDPQTNRLMAISKYLSKMFLRDVKSDNHSRQIIKGTCSKISVVPPGDKSSVKLERTSRFNYSHIIILMDGPRG